MELTFELQRPLRAPRRPLRGVVGYSWPPSSHTIAVEDLVDSDPEMYEIATSLGKDEIMRPAVLIYAGDLDPSGEDIERDFVERVGVFDEVRRAALNIEQLYDDDYLMFAGNPDGHRASEFKEKYLDMLVVLPQDHPVTDMIDELEGLFRVEINAMDDAVLKRLFQEGISKFWDAEAYTAVRARENDERDRL